MWSFMTIFFHLEHVWFILFFHPYSGVQFFLVATKSMVCLQTSFTWNSVNSSFCLTIFIPMLKFVFRFSPFHVFYNGHFLSRGKIFSIRAYFFGLPSSLNLVLQFLIVLMQLCNVFKYYFYILSVFSDYQLKHVGIGFCKYFINLFIQA